MSFFLRARVVLHSSLTLCSATALLILAGIAPPAAASTDEALALALSNGTSEAEQEELLAQYAQPATPDASATLSSGEASAGPSKKRARVEDDEEEDVVEEAYASEEQDAEEDGAEEAEIEQDDAQAPASILHALAQMEVLHASASQATAAEAAPAAAPAPAPSAEDPYADFKAKILK